MALKYFGGRTPSVDAPWTCPSCGAENQVPLKAGCQVCRAGADAKKVGSTPTQDAVRAAAPVPADPARPDAYVPTGAAPAQGADAEQAWNSWSTEVCRITHVPDLDLLKEAFMAGIAWARGDAQAARIEGRVTPPVVLAGWDFDQTTQHTILAALAFYRDNQLQYGAVPGQLDAQQVTDLIQRLSPQEE